MFHNILIVRNFNIILVSGCNLSILFNIVNLMNKFFSLRGLFLDNKLFDLKSIYQGFDFLGCRFIKTHDNISFTNISSNFLRDYKRKLKIIVKNSYSMSVVSFLLFLNEQISNWIFSFGSFSNSYSIYFSLDFYLYRLLWRWARRRHPRRPNTWIYSKYWKFINGRWNFVILDSNTGQFIFLKSHFSIGRKFYSLPFSLNVFSLLNESKINFVFFKKFSYKLNGIYYYLWKKQYGLCASCKKFLFINDFSSIKISSFSTSRKNTISYNFSRFVLLHKFCSYKF